MPVTTREGYERKKNRASLVSAAESRLGRDIGSIPAVADHARKREGSRSFRSFCEIYFPHKFSLAWSPDHLKVIAKIERAVIHGALLSVGMPRGSGKTTLCETAALWALLNGYHRFVMLLGSDEAHALQMLDALKVELSTNELLLADYPEVVYPIHRLENQSRRCVGQLHHGRLTHIRWSEDEIVMPSIPGSPASGSIVRVAGITGGIRGAKHTTASNESIRPTLVILDDPQTDESARSPSQCAAREQVVAGAILGLAGPGKKISALMPCTIIRRGDLADALLDRQKHPDWQGETTRMVYSWPARQDLWDEYAKLRQDELRNDGDGAQATEYYRQHRAEMDAGAQVAWEARHNRDEISAIQHAMNLRIRNPAAFAAEYQNEPVDETPRAEGLEPEAIAAKANGIPRGRVPTGHNRLTAFIDVQGNLLFWSVCSWTDDFSGHLVDYGAFPDQGRAYFTLRDATRTLRRAKPGAGPEAAIAAGLESLCAELLDRDWPREDGSLLRIERCLIDANWGDSTNIVRAFCRRSKWAALLTPSHGRYVSASAAPLADKAKGQGERVGDHWRVSVIKLQRHILWDTNHWKSFVASRLAVAAGDRGALTLWGRHSDHQMLADHLSSEHPVRVEAKGRQIDEWKLMPGRDNHWLDCLVGSAVAASMQGADLMTGTMGPAPVRKRVRLSDLQARKR